MKLKIRRHIEVDFFNSFSLNLKYDSIASSFSFDYYFDPENSGHRKAFSPAHFHTADVFEDGELLLRGTLLNPSFTSSSVKKLCSFSGYSLPGVLEDCEIPTSLYPLQSDGKTLKEIIEKLIEPFPFSLVIDGAVKDKANEVYDISTADEGSSIKDYITSLCSQKNIILSHTPSGNLLLTKAKTFNKPLFYFNESNIGLTSMDLEFNGQSMHSSITVMKQAGIDTDNAGEATVNNPFVPYTFRPKVKVQTSGNDNDSQTAAQNLLAQELKAIKLSITLSDWYLDGKLIKPNNIVKVKNKELHIYKAVNWFIESVTFTENESGKSCTLVCVLPQVYNGETPQNLFDLH